MILKNPKGNSRVQFPKYGTFAFTPECEVPDEFQEAIDHLLADGYIQVVAIPQAKKDEPVKVEIPAEEENGLKMAITPKAEESKAGVISGKFTCKKCAFATDNQGSIAVHYRIEHPKKNDKTSKRR